MALRSTLTYHVKDMTSDRRDRNLTRANILDALPEEEASRVIASESTQPLGDNDVYVDLLRLDQGVRRARGETQPVRPVLPKKAISEKTWGTIVQHITALQGAARDSKR